MKQKIIFTSNIIKDLEQTLLECNADCIFILTDKNTFNMCLPLINDIEILKEAKHIVVNQGDENKNIKSLCYIWEQLCDNGATRHSLLINLGGGMVTDMGGFAASTFKRGINFINIPTSLLAMVDASSGGKTGVNFNNLKNEIGTFSNPYAVFIYTPFLNTLPKNEFMSGYAEMIKHSLINNDTMFSKTLLFEENNYDDNKLMLFIKENVAVKENIVTKDPHEKGLRKTLNFGHTFGHAFETFSLLNNAPIAHGFAVAYGLVCELYLSHIILNFPLNKLRQTHSYIKEHYAPFNILCSHYDKIIELMHHDKKNIGKDINFTLLNDIGRVKLNCSASVEEIKNALDFLREG